MSVLYGDWLEVGNVSESREVITFEGRNLLAQSIHNHHTINYIEFGVTDMEASKRFYSEAFGWAFNDYGPEYAGIRSGSGEVGGLRLDSEVCPGGPLVVLYSEKLDDSVAIVRSAGGRVTKDPFEFPGGRRFHFKDPSGNELAVWSEK